MSSSKKRENLKVENKKENDTKDENLKTNTYESHLMTFNGESQTGSFTTQKHKTIKNVKDLKASEAKPVKKKRSPSHVKNPKPK